MKRFWTARRDQLLRSCYQQGVKAAARRLGITRHAVATRACKLGLQTGRNRFWTEAELDRLRELYPTHTLRQIATTLGRGISGVSLRAFKLGLTGPKKIWPEAIRDRVAELSRQLTDEAIAQRLAVEFGADAPARRSVSYIRSKLGIPVNHDAVLEARRRGVQTQARKLGIRPGGGLRQVAHARLARQYGLPEDLGPRHVQIVLYLLRGPATRQQIARAIGVIYIQGQSRRALKSNSHGSYTADLLAKGLVSSQRVYRRKYHWRAVYSLTPLALELLAAARKEVAHAS
jgi:hypothetical protein